MQPQEYRTMFEFESFYWWYRGLHLILLDTLKSLGLTSSSRILDAGCGTGQNLAHIKAEITEEAYGFDASVFASQFWHRRNLERVCIASINEIPFPAHTFDAAVSVDVLECESVRERDAYAELCRVVRPGGFVVLVLPAYEWLMNPGHHKAVAAVRRYSRSRVRELVMSQPVELVRFTHLFGTLLPAVACKRLADRYVFQRTNGEARSDLQPLPKTLNELLLGIVRVERRFVRKHNLPFGSSILAVVRKVGR